MERLNIAITGASGFIGSNIFRHFNKHHNVYALGHSAKNWRLDGIKPIYLDITNRNKCKSVIGKLRPDILIHCAAYGINYNETDQKRIIETNLIGTLNVLDACREVSLFVNTGSCFEYGIQNKSISEDMPIAPTSTYAMSKALSTIVSQSYKDVKCVTLRLFTAYGYYEAKQRLVPYLILSALSGATAKLSNRNNVRDFIFIEDVVNAYAAVIKNHNKIKNHSIFNVGSGKQVSVADVTKIVGSDVKWIQSVRPKEPIQIWQADIRKIKRELNWYPQYSLEEGIKKTQKWISENMVFYEG